MKARLLPITIVLLLSGAVSSAAAKSYSVDSITINSRVNTDGTVAIHESIQYTFHGSYSFAYRDIPLKRGESITDIAISGSSGPYVESSSEAPGTFTVRKTSQGVRVTWYYRAQSEPRTFEFSFMANGVVRRHADVAEFYYQFVGDGWDRRIGSVTATVEFANSAYKSDIKAWAHGPLYGTVSIEAGGRVVMAVAPLPANTFWEGRIVFDPVLVPGAQEGSPEPRLQAIMAQEAEWVDEANRQRERQQRRYEEWAAQQEVLRERARRYTPIAFLAGLAALAFWFVLWRRHGRKHDVRSLAAPGEFPSDHAPAVVAYLQTRSVGAGAIVATLVDLAERGYFTIRESVEEKSSWFGKRKQTDYVFERTEKLWSDMAPWELELVEFLITEVGDMDRFTVNALKKTARRNRTHFRKWFQAWIKSVKAAGQQYGFFEPYPVGAMLQNAGVGVAVLALGIFFTAHSKSPAGAPAMIAGFLTAVMTATLTRRTVDGQRLADGWNQFKHHLKSISRGLGPVTLDSHTWSRYLGLAIVFGMHKRLLPRISPVDEHGGVYYPVWYHGALFNSSDPSAGLSGFADSVTSMVSAVSSTMSSASGTGGGASGGGGGGSGGGGGGAG